MALIGLSLTCGMLALAPSASGQAGLDQYLPSAPTGGHQNHGHQGRGGGGGSNSGSTSSSPSTSTQTTQSSAPKKHHKVKPQKEPAAPKPVPTTPTAHHDSGYPISPFVLIVIVLFLLGLVIKFGPELIRRVRFRTVY
jgi:hypothetical protein